MRVFEPESMAVVTDAELIAGTRYDFGLLFDRHATAIYRYVLRRIGPDAVDDVVAEAFLIAFERRHRFDHAYGSALPWLYGIATNVLRRHRATELRYHRAMAALPVSPHDPPLADRAAERVDAEARFGALAADLARLHPRHRDVLYLYAAGLTYADIAVALDVPIGTVMSRLHRARTKLKSVLPADSPSGDVRHEAE